MLVRTLDVHVKDDLDPLEPAIDPLGDPDFYAVVTIEGNPYTETMQLDRSSITPSWTSFRILPAGIGKVAVTYSLFDEDGQVRGDDDHCDINPEAGVLDVSLPFTLSDGSLGRVGGRTSRTRTARWSRSASRPTPWPRCRR